MLLRLLLLDESVIEEALSVVRPLRKVHRERKWLAIDGRPKRHDNDGNRC
jgi:hypothetical protein